MEILHLAVDAHDLPTDPVLVVAMDGWTDAGRAGSLAAERLMDTWEISPVGEADGDALYDYRDRRPTLPIDRGLLGDPEWPGLEVMVLRPPGGRPLLVVHGAEPDFSWRGLSADLVELAELAGAKEYIGLGSVPGPIPHTRPPRIVTTSSSEELLEEMGRAHEQVVVPASCQVVLETALRDAGLLTLGLWARIPHYVAGEYPAGAVALLERFTSHLEATVDLSPLERRAEEHREQLDAAAGSSPEILQHIEELEERYDADTDRLALGPLPTGDEIAAELQRFLREQEED